MNYNNTAREDREGAYRGGGGRRFNGGGSGYRRGRGR